jgi:hypothetical protein
MRQLAAVLRSIPMVLRGHHVAARINGAVHSPAGLDERDNPLRTYFNSVQQGRGIWKWNHYFDVYHRHLHKFTGQPVHVAEVGVYSGGSLDMWKQYFGPHCTVYGIDCQKECKEYEDERTRIFIGDQADREFWAEFRRQVPQLDVLIDDGGHQTQQQIVTLEEILPHLRPGGVYICEDITGANNKFSAYLHGLQNELNAAHFVGESTVQPTVMQQSIESVHLYPFIAVIEKRAESLENLRAPKHGTQWQPFHV